MKPPFPMANQSLGRLNIRQAICLTTTAMVCAMMMSPAHAEVAQGATTLPVNTRTFAPAANDLAAAPWAEQLVVRLHDTTRPEDAARLFNAQTGERNAAGRSGNDRLQQSRQRLQEWVGRERERAQTISNAHGSHLKSKRMMGDGSHVMRFEANAAPSERMRTFESLRADPRVASVAIDRRTQPQAAGPVTGAVNVLSSSARSWFLKPITQEAASTNTATLWQRYHGDSSTIVAVVDTGVLPGHPSLRGRLLPGFDMVTDAFTANDAQAASTTSSRDNDASDPGNGVSFADSISRPECGTGSNSTWHGTFVSALIAANPAQSEQVFPINWHGQILPVRALGRCGGFTSDLADGVRWAVGITVPGTTANRTPANVVNLSLGATGPCVSAIEGSAIREALNRGVVVVAAAGNRGGALDSPSNCDGVIAVGAVDQEGLKADYSNFGAGITLMAPGGDASFPIWSASNSGLMGPGTNTYSSKIGTSFATPLVASTISLMRSLNPSLTPSGIEQILRQTARPFLTRSGVSTCSGTMQSTACNCTTAQCGAGMLDTAAAVNAARPGQVLANLIGPSVVNPGSTERFDASGSFNPGSSALNWRWRVISFTGSSAPVIANEAVSTTDIRFPEGLTATQLGLTVSNGSQSHDIIKNVLVQAPGTAQADVSGALANLLVGSIGAATGAAGFSSDSAGGGSADPSAGNSTSPASSGGGGGGQLPPASLLALLSGLLLLRRSHHRA